jgi:hypothetical protein
LNSNWRSGSGVICLSLAPALLNIKTLATHRHPIIQLRIPHHTPIRIPHIIPQQHIHNNHLQLVRRKEPARAGVPPVPEHQALRRHADELVLRRALFARAVVLGPLPQLVEAQRVKGVGVRVDGRVAADGLGGGFDDDAGGDGLAGGEGEGLEDFAAEGGWEER